MNHINWGKIFWEAFKAFGPAFIAWWLAVLTSKRNSKEERHKILEQLDITKKNNIEAQNKSFKLQFCLSELQKKDEIYEELISDINVVIQSVERFRNPRLNEENIAVMTSANEALKQLHETMFNAGSLTSLIKATKSNYKEYESIFNKLTDQGKEVEKELHFLVTGIRNRISSQTFDSNYNPNVFLQFEEELMQMQSFIMKIIMELFAEMD